MNFPQVAQSGRHKCEEARKTHRVAAFVSLLIVTPLGFACKFYSGRGAWWFNDYAGGIMYEVFWCLAATFTWPRASATSIAAWVLAITCSLEFLQLWHPRFLEIIRATFIGRTLIGTSFSWWDLPHYLLGCCAGWLWVRYLRERRFSYEFDRHDR
jgi:hypothetical protein